MKKINLLLSAILISTGLGFGQSVTITPNEATAQGVNAEIEIKKLKTNSVDGAELTGYRSRLSGSTDAPVTSGQDLMIINAKGFTGINGYQSGGFMKFEASENWTAAAIGTDFRLSLGNTSGGISTDEWLTIKSSGDVGLGSKSPSAKLDIPNLSTNDDYPSIRLLQLNPNGFNRIKFENLSKDGNFVIASKIETDAKNSRLHLYAGGVGNVLSITGDGNIINNGYTQLGAEASDVPKIKMKKLTGTTAASPTTGLNIPHGLDYNKILAVDIFIKNPGTNGVTYPPSGNGLHNPSDLYRYHITTVNVVLNNLGTDLQGQPYRVLITYEE